MNHVVLVILFGAIKADISNHSLMNLIRGEGLHLHYD